MYAVDFRFLVLMAREGNGTERMQFSKISGLSCSLEYEEIAEGGRNEGPHIVAAPHKRHEPLVLERGIAEQGSRLVRLKPGMRLNTPLMIYPLDAAGNKGETGFWIEDGIVTKWETGGLDAMGRSILVERFEIMHDGIRYSG